MAAQVPLVDYLVLGDDPHLEAKECTACGARYFDRRNACAACGAAEFRPAMVATQGEVRAFTIVSMAAPGVPVPFVAAVVDCDGTSVRGNVVDVEPTPEHVRLGMKVELTTFPIGTDSDGTEAVGFGFRPLEAEPPGEAVARAARSEAAGAGNTATVPPDDVTDPRALSEVS